jgi:sugar phosphate isomerase/epimerase
VLRNLDTIENKSVEAGIVMMKLAFSTLGCPDWELDSIVARAAEYGYTGIEIRGILRQFDLTRIPELTDNIETTKELLSSYGLSVACVSASARFSSLNPTETAKNIRSAKEHMDIARTLEAPCVRVFGGNIPEGADREKYEDHLAEALQELGDYGRQGGVKVALETHDSYCTGKLVAAVLEKTVHPMVGVVWDIYHPLRNGESPERTIGFLRSKIIHVHIKDGNFSNHTLLGNGKVPVVKILRLLRKNDYTGYLSVEWEKAWKPDLAPPEVVLPQYASRLKEYLAQVTEA